MKKQEDDHSVKIKFLQNIIDDLMEMQKNQESKTILSDALIKNLHTSRTKIDQRILGLQKEIIEKLAVNNLLD